jgi:hypothetical protein
MSPYAGWSTFWLLAALADNMAAEDADHEELGPRPLLESFDLLSYSRQNVPREMYVAVSPESRDEEGTGGLNKEQRLPRWRLVVGDAAEILQARAEASQKERGILFQPDEPASTQSLLDWAICEDCYDYIFLDSAHTHDFGAWYTGAVLERQLQLRRRASLAWAALGEDEAPSQARRAQV